MTYKTTTLVTSIVAITAATSLQAAVFLADSGATPSIDSAVTGATSGTAGEFTLNSGIYSSDFSSDNPFGMLVVSVSREASSETFGVTYDGVAMNLATGTSTGSGASIFYLETSAQSGTIALDFSGSATVNGIGLGVAALNSSTGDFFLVDAQNATGTDSISVEGGVDDFSFFAGDANSTTGSVSIDSPLTTIFAGPADIGSNQAGAGYHLITSAGTQNYSWSPNVTSRQVSAVVFSSVPEPSAFALLAGVFGLTWVMVRRRAQ